MFVRENVQMANNKISLDINDFSGKGAPAWQSCSFCSSMDTFKTSSDFTKYV